MCAINDCDDNDPNLPAPVGSSCDDGNPDTTNDVILADGCTCEGTDPNTGSDCASISISTSLDTIIIGGLEHAPITTIQIFDPFWSEVFNCAGNCNPSSVSIPGLASGVYFVKVGFYDANWAPLCSVEDFYNVDGSSLPNLRRALEFNAAVGPRRVDLSWGTNSGDINDHFVIERSTDGLVYETLVRRPNEFTDAEVRLYQDMDPNPVEGWNYYRLKQVHVDGTYVLTAERRVRFEQDVNEFSLFPNPTEAEVFVHFQSLADMEVVVEISNSLGQVIIQRQYELAPEGPIGFDLSQLNAGVYAVSVQAKGRKRLTKLLVVTRR